AEEAADFGRLLQATIRQMGVSDAHMEEGSLRADANVSIRPAGEATFGTKTELKNMNSWSFLRRGIQAELARQEEILAGGGEVEQETLHFDPQTGTLSPLRSKEEAHDYRYFPEPDLVPLAPTEAMLARAREAIPELPAERAERFESELGLPEETARVLAHRFELGDFYEQAVSANSDAEGGAVRAEGEGAPDPKTLANWVKNELVPRLGDADPGEWKVDPGALARLVALVGEKAVSQSAAKDVLDTLVAEGGDPQAIVEAKGLTKAGGDELAEVVDRALEGNPDIVEKLKADPGDKSIGAIVGAVMRETKGRADGGEVQRLIRERIA
ncbi:MAG: Asp-tRNA(Asn)/Glu-tRNA(Gln) amidotransferase GatCAB subunit B, partial [Thermoleophilaceae bacterium]